MTSSSAGTKSKHLVELDGLRGLALSAVVCCHFVGPALDGTNSLATKLVSRIFDTGWLGVDIFFVLSGYLITGVILSGRQTKPFWSDFYLRRAFRILPLFLVVATICLLITRHIQKCSIALTLLFAANWNVLFFGEIPLLSHVWSLAIEEQFYFAWPQVAGRLAVQKVFVIGCGVALFSDVTRLVMVMNGVSGWIIYKVTFSRLDGIAIGAALAAGVQMPSVFRFLRRFWTVGFVIGLAGVLLAFGSRRLSLYSWDPRAQLLAIPFVAIATAATIFAACVGELKPAAKRVLSSRFLVYLGKRSYGMYLIHVPLMAALPTASSLHIPNNLPTKCSIALAGIALALILTEISWWLIEKPAQDFGKRLRSQPLKGLDLFDVGNSCERSPTGISR